MLVTRRLGDENTPDVITQKIQRKVRELAEMCGVELTATDNAEPTEQPEQPAPQQPVELASDHLPEEDYNADETWQHDNGEEFKEVFSLEYMEPEHEVPVADREPDEDISVEFIEAEDPTAADIPQPASAEPAAPSAPVTPPPFRQELNNEPVPEPDPEFLPEAEDEPDIPVEFIDASNEPLPEPEDEMPMPPLPTDFPEVDEPAAPLRVDEKLQRTMSKDIRKAFSVNDRFRFQRELFAGSANAMNTAIEHIEMMTSYGNAELYFFSQLHWDRDNQDVKDFMEIVRNHYQK